jgi:hypothetical protein
MVSKAISGGIYLLHLGRPLDTYTAKWRLFTRLLQSGRRIIQNESVWTSDVLVGHEGAGIVHGCNNKVYRGDSKGTWWFVCLPIIGTVRFGWSCLTTYSVTQIMPDSGRWHPICWNIPGTRSWTWVTGSIWIRHQTASVGQVSGLPNQWICRKEANPS